MNVRMTIRPMILALAGSGMIMLNGSTAYAATTVTAATDSSTQSAVNIGEVSRGNIYATAKESKQKKKLHSTLHVVHISKKQIDNSVPPGGSIAFALKNVPGVQIQGYGGMSGAQRDEIRLNGVTAGWTGTGSNPERDALQFNFDGIPMNDPYADWEGFETSTVPISAIFSGIKVTQGPGNPASRYYDSLGGTINLIPWAPSSRPSAQVSIGGGSFNSYNASAVLQTGDIDGWKTVLAGGYTHSGSFLNSDGNYYNGSSQGSAVYIKTKRSIMNHAGTFSIAGYFSNIEEFRPDGTPVYNTPGVTVNGDNKAGAYYSQQAQGYYYTAPNSMYFKNVQGHVYMIWARLMEHLTQRLQVTDTAYFRSGHRLHNVNNYYSYDAYAEWYHVDRDTFGDRLAFQYHLPSNLIKFGLNYITMRTKHDQQGYSVDPAYGGPLDPTYIRDLLYNWENFAPYIQDKISLLHGNLTIVPGLMLEHYDYRWIDNSASTIPAGDPYLTPTGPTNVIPVSLSTNAIFLAPNKHVTYNNLEPSIGVNYKFIHHLAAYFTWAEHHTTPQEGAFWSPNADEVPLAPVTVHSFIGGLRYVNGPISASISGFLQQFKNQFLLTQTAYEGGLIENISKLSATYNGVNLSVGYHPKEGFNALLNTSFQHDYYNKYVGSNGIAYHGLPISNVPDFMVNASVGYGWFSDQTAWRVNLNDTYDGAIPLINENTGLPTTVKWGGHNVVNLYASARTAMFNRDIPDLRYLKFTLGVDNLLDRKYESIVSLGSFAADTPLTYIGLAGAPLSVYGSLSAAF